MEGSGNKVDSRDTPKAANQVKKEKEEKVSNKCV